MIRISFILVLLTFVSCKNEPKFNRNVSEGEIFGTYFRIQYFDTSLEDYSESYDSIFQEINGSMSTYDKNSDISKVNKGDSTILIDTHFKTVLEVSKKIFKETNQAFDPTIGVLVNAWDFGPEGRVVGIDSLKIDSLLSYVGLNKVKFNADRILKPKHTYIDFNAIAKGYALDVIAEFLIGKGKTNFLIDIGGEIRASGHKYIGDKPYTWIVGVEDPNFDGSKSHQKEIELRNKSMATSGVYRKFKVDDDGKKYSHIIDTKTGYPSKTNILSVSVIANTCMEADAYATAFKVMGIDAVRAFLKQKPELQVYFIYENSKAELKTMSLNGFGD